MNPDEELGVWTFQYRSEDGNGHALTVTAETFLAARETFLKTVGEDTSFIVTK